MSAIILDAFDRVAADLTTSPAGRWAAPSGGGGTNAWRADGQFAKTGTTFGASSRGQLRWTGYDAGINYGEVRVRFQRGTTQVQEIGLFARSHRVNMSDHRRLAVVWRADTVPTRWEIRWYSTYTAFNIVLVAPDNVTGFSIGTGWHDLKLRFVPVNCQTTANTSACSAPAATLAVSAWVDNIILFGAVTTPDYTLVPGPLADYRGIGLEVLSAAGWAGATDYAAFDNIELDNLVTPSVEPSPSLAAEPTLTPITVTSEGVAVSSLPFTPDIGEEITKQWFTVREPMEAPYEVTWARFQIGRRLFAIGHSSLTQSERGTLEAFLDSHKGPETPFTYVTDQGETIKAHFLQGTFDFARFGIDNVRCEYVIEELVI